MIVATLLLLPGLLAHAQEPEEETAASEESPAIEETANEDNGDGIESPKTMSGMSILGNEEAPKSLVIVPWKSSELGDDISLSDTLDDRARPVDKEVFLRELNFYEIRAAETPSN
jgi:hypothetical protein